MSGYESCSPEEGPADMDCYGQQYFCNTRPHFREIHCQNGLASPAEHLGLSEEDISPQQYWPHSRVGSPQSYGNHAHGFMHHQHGGYNGYGYEESHHMSDGQYFQYTNSSLSHSAPALSMDCETQQHTTLHQNGSGKMSSVCAPIVRVVKRRNTANKKERRRTQSINTAFADLRDCIPNVPCDTKLSKVSAGKRDTRRTDTINCAFSLLRNRIPNVPTDTKLSKIKTLRLATSYISYLMGVLESDLLEPAEGFRAELAGQGRRSNRGNGGAGKKGNNNNNNGETNNCQIKELSPSSQDRRSKGRTGWPQHVWALELKQEQNL